MLELESFDLRFLPRRTQNTKVECMKCHSSKEFHPLRNQSHQLTAFTISLWGSQRFVNSSTSLISSSVLLSVRRDVDCITNAPQSKLWETGRFGRTYALHAETVIELAMSDNEQILSDEIDREMAHSVLQVSRQVWI